MEDIVYAEGLEATVNEILIKISELCGVAFDYAVKNTPLYCGKLPGYLFLEICHLIYLWHL